VAIRFRSGQEKQNNETAVWGVKFFKVLNERGVIRAAILYAAGAFGAIEILDWLIQSLALGLPSWLIPGIAIVFLAGFPVALYMAWVTDIEQKPFYTITAAALILVGGSLALFFAVDPLDSGTPRLAVMMPLGEGPPDDVAVWASSDLRDLLSEIDELQVLGRTTVMMASMVPAEADERLADFGATHRVRSELVRGSGRLQYSVMLEDKGGKEIWSDSYTGVPMDLFEFQKSAVEKISGALGVPADAAGLRVLRLRPNPTEKLEAFEALSRGQAKFWMAGDILCERAMADFERAIEVDPAMGRAYMNKGMCLGLRAWLPELPRDHPLWETAVVNIRRAAELDPTLSREAYERVADFEAARNRWDASREALEKAKSVDADAFSFVYSNSTGYCAEVIERMSADYELDPLSPLNASLVSMGYLTCPGMVEREEGLRWLEIARGTQSGGNSDRAIPALLEAGERAEAEQLWDENVAELMPQLRAADIDLEELRDLEFAALQDGKAVAAYVAKIRELGHQGLFPSHRSAFVFITVGATDDAYEALSETIEAQRFNIHHFMQYGTGPRQVREDPRYMQVLERVGLVDHWRKYGLPPLCETDENNEVHCI
jgi:tetratricopeptide (TPR) repeat protein/TolB-like protein